MLRYELELGISPPRVVNGLRVCEIVRSEDFVRVFRTRFHIWRLYYQRVKPREPDTHSGPCAGRRTLCGWPAFGNLYEILVLSTIIQRKACMLAQAMDVLRLFTTTRRELGVADVAKLL